MTRDEFFRDVITTWEGGLSLDPDDGGNWFAAPGAEPVLIGSHYGVTGAALAAFRGAAVVTARDMSALTLDEAVRIAGRLYFREPGFDRLPWDPLIASTADFGWGAGPRQAILLLQRLIGVADDGQVGAFTAAAYRQYVASHGIERAARQWWAARDAHYGQVARKRPVAAKYLRGWKRRSAYFAPGASWWMRFTAVPMAA